MGHNPGSERAGSDFESRGVLNIRQELHIDRILKVTLLVREIVSHSEGFIFSTPYEVKRVSVHGSGFRRLLLLNDVLHLFCVEDGVCWRREAL